MKRFLLERFIVLIVLALVVLSFVSFSFAEESKTITISPETKFQLAPWCYLATRGIFHDYHAKYYPIPKLEAWLAESDTLSFTEKEGRSILWDEMQQWYRMGILVPLTD